MGLEALEDLDLAILELCEQNPQAWQVSSYILAQAGCYGLNCNLPKYMFKSLNPVPTNVTLLGNRDIAGVIK